MEELYPRLQQLRAELEQSYASTDGLSALFAIRRELLRYYHGVSLRQLMRCPRELHRRFDQAQQGLQTAPAFPSMSHEAHYTATEQALAVLEQVSQCEAKHFEELLS